MKNAMLKQRGCESIIKHFLLVLVVLYFLSATLMVAQTKGQFNAIIQENSQAVLEVSGVEMILDSGKDTVKKNPNRLHIESTLEWQNLMTEDFEGDFPAAGWQTYNNSGYTETYWNDASCKPYNGEWSAFCAAGGSQSVSCGQYYPNNMKSWMIYGPFDLSNATDAELLFSYWNNSESDYDYFKVFASVDNSNFYGWRVSGNSNGWVSASFDLTDVYVLGNLLGQSQVWIAFNFISDGSTTAEGAFVDDIVLRKYLYSNDPTNLVAGSNFKNIITLNWRAPASAIHALGNKSANISIEQNSAGLAVDYYKVYRKVTASGSYTSIGMTNTINDYIDNDVTPGTIYYYKVTAVIDDVESGFSNESFASCNSIGYSVILPTSIVPPTIDGIVNTSEWSDAYRLDIKNTLGIGNDPPSQDVFAYLKIVDNYLFLAVKDFSAIADVTDDQIGFYFDNNNNNNWDVGDGNIWLTRTTTSISITFREITGAYPDALLFGTPVENPVGVIGSIAMDAGHMEYEIRFDMKTSPFQPTGSSFGFWVYSFDGYIYSFTGRYANAAVWTAPISYVDVDLLTSINDRLFSSIPDFFKLYQNTPNPFNPSTIIRYDLSKEGMVSINVYDLLGREVKTLVNEYKNAGSYDVEFNANNLSSGTYFYRITTGDFADVKKLLLLK